MRRFLQYVVRVLVLVVVFMVSALTAMRFAIHGRQTKIPKLVGMTTPQAERALADRGLVLQPGDRFFSSDVPPGRVMSQVPAPGEQVRRGWRVRVAESMGPQRVVIPDLLGGSERAAEINIRRRGLELAAVADRNHSWRANRSDCGAEPARQCRKRVRPQNQCPFGCAGRPRLVRHARSRRPQRR